MVACHVVGQRKPRASWMLVVKEIVGSPKWEKAQPLPLRNDGMEGRWPLWMLHSEKVPMLNHWLLAKERLRLTKGDPP